MMTKMKIIFAATLLIFFSVIACQKEIVVPTDNVSVKEAKKESFRNGSSNNTSLTPSQITQIGILHNQYLGAAFTNYNYNNTDEIAEINRQFLSVQMNGLNQQDKQAIISNPNYLDENYLVNNINDPVALGYINNANAALTSSSNLNDVQQRIANIKNAIGQDNNIINKTVPLIYCEVMLNSAKFWLPTTLGGNGTGNNIIINLGGTPAGLSLFWKTVIADSVGAAVGGLLGGGLGAGAGAAFASMTFVIVTT